MRASKPVLLVLLALIVVAAAAAGPALNGALRVATGYSAKQLCSGVFVAGLPEDFIIERDINPTMSILGPARGALEMRVDETAGAAEASLLWSSARASYRRGRGCTLGITPVGDATAPPPAAVPASPGVPAGLGDAFERAFAEPSGGGRNTLAVLVSVAGNLVAERYRAPVDARTPMQGWSMNKSLMSTWVGMQTRAGRLNPAVPLAQASARPELADLDPSLTLLHLLQMESGFDFVEVYGPGSDVTRMLYASAAMWQVPASREQAFAPGEHFSYSSGDTVLASLVWQDSLDRPYEQWIRENFTAPLGLSALIAEADSSGVQVGSSYAYLTPRDWLAVGQLWLDAWHGRSELLDAQWLRESVTPRPSDDRGRYGRGFWLNTDGVAFHGVPDTLFYAGGHSGQFVVVIPEWDTVVVRLGLTEAGVDEGVGDLLRAVGRYRAAMP